MNQTQPNPTPITTRKLKSWLATYADFTTDTEAPAEFHMWTAVSTIAAAMNRKCWIDMGTFEIYPSMYIIFVAPPGVATKSTTARIGEELLEATDAIAMASDSITWQALLDELEESQTVVTLEPGKPSVTISPLHVFASELGTFLDMSDQGMINLLIELWDGKRKYRRKTRSGGGITIPRPYMNLLGCTTPSWLSSNAEEYFIGGGFFSRTIFVYADKKEKLIAYPKDTFNKDLLHKLQEDLKHIAKLTGKFTLAKEAQAYGEEWYTKTHTQTPKHLLGEKFQAYISRRQNHLHKVAMVISASEACDRVITLEHMLAAEGMLYMAETNLRIIYDSIVTNDKVGVYKRVKLAIQKFKEVNKRTLFQELSHQISYQDFEEAIKSLSFAGEIVAMQKAGDLYIKWVK